MNSTAHALQAGRRQQIKPRRWLAKLNMDFESRAGKTVLARVAREGPLAVQRAFYPEGEALCHVYLLHPPGGVVGGDELTIGINCDVRACTLMTTPAAGKFYRSAASKAHVHHQLAVHQNACLEYLPQENILFNNSLVETSTRVTLDAQARFIGWECTSLGRRAAAEPYTQGSYRQSFQIWRDGRPLFLDTVHITGACDMLRQPWGLGGYTDFATLVAVDATRATVARARASVAGIKDVLVSATLVGPVLVCRVLSHRAETAKLALIAIWRGIRPQILGREACRPRIWNT